MTYLAKVTFPYFTALPEDVIVNTWHFTWLIGDPAEGDFANLNANLGTFYSTVYSDAGAVRFAPWVDFVNNTLQVYNLEDAEPRPAIYEAGMALTGVGSLTTSTVTPETAICLSYQADAAAGIPQARRRGRVFLGGLGTAIQAGSGVTFPGVASANRTLIAGAADTFAGASGTDGWIWVVHSRTVAGDSVVTNGWVDDEPDTQRRRGREATVRTLWSV